MTEIVRPAEEQAYRPWNCPKQAPPMACPPLLRSSCASLTGFPATFSPKPLQCPKGDPPVPIPEPFHPDLQSTSHFYLKATRDVLPDPSKGPVFVSIVDGSKGKVVQKMLDRSTTVAALKQKFLQEMPDLQWLSLSCNGKPVQEHDVLKDLRLGEKVTFVTFQRCHGG